MNDDIQLRRDRDGVREQIAQRIAHGHDLLAKTNEIADMAVLEAHRRDYYTWDEFNGTLLTTSFVGPILQEYQSYGAAGTIKGPWSQPSLSHEVEDLRDSITTKLRRLESIQQRLDLFEPWSPLTSISPHEPEQAELSPEIAEQVGSAVELEELVDAYLRDSDFDRRFREAYRLWKQAAEMLRDDDGSLAAQIGYACRETIQEFADTLVREYQPPSAPANRAETFNRMRAVLDHCAPQLGESKKDFLDALYDYWRKLIGLVQRQAKGAEREGEALVLDDGRRVVFHTAVVMYELARTLPPPPP